MKTVKTWLTAFFSGALVGIWFDQRMNRQPEATPLKADKAKEEEPPRDLIKAAEPYKQLIRTLGKTNHDTLIH